MSTVAEEITKLEKEIGDKQKQLDKLKAMAAAYPDLQVYVGRWNKVVYCSASVNEKVTDYECRHNCGCCSDSSLEIYPYIETEFGRVNSYPTCFWVGRGSTGCGDIPDPDWEEPLRKAKIPEKIIEQVGYHFKRYEEDSEETVED